MGVKYWEDLDGMYHVKTVGDLVKYAKELSDIYGDETEYSCDAYKLFEGVALYRDETEIEKYTRQKIEEYSVLLEGCHDSLIHHQAVRDIGHRHYENIIFKLNQEKRA